MPRPKPDVQSVGVLIRLQPDDIAMIDERRGDVSRAQWVKTLVTLKLASLLPQMSDEEVGRVMRSIEPPEPQKQTARLTLSDVRPKFEPRFKKPKGAKP